MKSHSKPFIRVASSAQAQEHMSKHVLVPSRMSSASKQPPLPLQLSFGYYLTETNIQSPNTKHIANKPDCIASSCTSRWCSLFLHSALYQLAAGWSSRLRGQNPIHIHQELQPEPHILLKVHQCSDKVMHAAS